MTVQLALLAVALLAVAWGFGGTAWFLVTLVSIDVRVVLGMHLWPDGPLYDWPEVPADG